MQRINWPSGVPHLIRDAEVKAEFEKFVDLRDETADLEFHSAVRTALSQQVGGLLERPNNPHALVWLGQDKERKFAIIVETEFGRDSDGDRYWYYLYSVNQEEWDLLSAWVAECKSSAAAATPPKTLEELYRLHAIDDASVEARRAALRSQYGFQNS